MIFTMSQITSAKALANQILRFLGEVTQ